MHNRPPEQRQVPDGEQDAEFGRPKAPERNAKLAQRVRRQIRLDREHQKSDEQADRDPGMHVSGQGEAAHQGESAEAVDHVVDVESVARTQALADAGERSVE